MEGTFLKGWQEGDWENGITGGVIFCWILGFRRSNRFSISLDRLFFKSPTESSQNI